jgi:hypothetical protein
MKRKLTPAQIDELKSDYAAGWKLMNLAIKYKIDRQSVRYHLGIKKIKEKPKKNNFPQTIHKYVPPVNLYKSYQELAKQQIVFARDMHGNVIGKEVRDMTKVKTDWDFENELKKNKR